MKRIFVMALLSVVFMQSAHSLTRADTYRMEEDANTDPKVYAYISPVEIAAPLGYFLVVNKGNDICAIRFTTFRRGNDAKKPSLFNGGEENLYAEYDWYYLGNDPKFERATGHEQLNRSRTVQILGFHGFLLGKREINCGNSSLIWRYPVAITFMGSGGTYLPDTRIGITPWTDFSQLNLNSPLIKWFLYDPDRKREFIQIDKIIKK